MKNQTMKLEATNLFQILKSPRWIVMLFLLPMLMMHFAMAAPSVDPVPVATLGVSVGEKFDHVKTGFNLTGAHATARCTSCHINNVFKGAPRDCATCHRAANLMAATSKPSNHINTIAQCDTCHKTTVWTPAIFSHVGMPDGQCATCHNGTTALGKSRNHIPVPATISCDNCHKTSSWLQYAFSHKNINSGCSDCHGGQTFTGVPVQPKSKPNNHYLTALDCGTCHFTTNFTILKRGAPVSITVNHIPTGAQACEICHNGGSFAPAHMSHAGITSNCEQCHDNGSGGSKTYSEGVGVTPKSKADAPSTHITTTLPCVQCHTVTTSFTLPPGSIIPMPVGHLPSAQPCSTCHALPGFIPAKMSHAGISVNCADCHTAGKTYSGSPKMRIVAKSGTHVRSGMVCETCHNGSNTTGFTSFLGTGSLIMKHTGIVNGCKDCHITPYPYSGQPAVAKSAASPIHVPTSRVTLGGDCETCHSATGFSSFSGALMKHTGIVNLCKDCHDGSTSFQGMGKATYWPTGSTNSAHLSGMDCASAGCHTTTTFSGASGTKSANHIPTTSTCSTCHLGGTGNTATMLASGHAGISSGCGTACHSGRTFADHTSATGMKPKSKADFPPHVSTPLDCASCHYPSSNGFSDFSGASAGLPLDHLPTSQPCTTCHLNGTGPGSGQMNHVGIVSGCANCHDNKTFAKFMTPKSKPTDHIPTNIPTAQPCEACHSISNFNSFSGTAMKHTGITDRCASCHDAGTIYSGIVKLPVNHVPTSSTGVMGAAGSTCETCHSKTNFGTFSGTLMNHAGVTAKPCKDCHASQAFAGGTPRNVNSIANHIPYATSLLGGSTMDCNKCHLSTAVGGFATLSVSSSVMHNGSQGNSLASGICVTCHLSKKYLGVTGTKSHNGASAAKDCSSSGCHKPLGSKGASYTSWD